MQDMNDSSYDLERLMWNTVRKLTARTACDHFRLLALACDMYLRTIAQTPLSLSLTPLVDLKVLNAKPSKSQKIKP